MRPLYDARIEELGDGDFLRVECVACGHDELIPHIGLVVGLRLRASMKVLDLRAASDAENATGVAAWRCRLAGHGVERSE